MAHSGINRRAAPTFREPVPFTEVVIAAAPVSAGAALWSKGADFQKVATAPPELSRFSALGG